MKTDNKMPTALILADQLLDSGLKKIFSEVEKSSLMIAGYSVIDHLLMELRDLNFQQCIVIAKGSAKKLQANLENTKRWGMTITVMEYSLSKEQVLREYKSLSEPNGLLVLEMNKLRSHCVKDFLDQAASSEYSLLEAVSSGVKSGMTLLKHSESDLIINAMPIELEGLVFNPLSTSRDFHQANFDVVSGLYKGLEPSVQHNSKLGRRQHWASHVHKHSRLVEDELMIDRHCQVGKEASLDSVILNHDVFIERNAQLENTVVMPNSVVSNQQQIKNAIVNDGVVFQIH